MRKEMSKKVNYIVEDHHSFWGWEKQLRSTEKQADIIFVWNDFSIKEKS